MRDRLMAHQANTLRYVRYLDDFPASRSRTLWDDTVTSGFVGPKVYVVQTNTKVIERCLLMTTDPGDLVLDPTCGSGTTAYVAEQWGRRWITIDTSRVALALARQRLMGARFPYYLLSRLVDGRAKESELLGDAAASGRGHQRHPPWLRLRARAAHHAQVDRQQPGHRRGHEPRGDRRGDPPAR